MATAAPADIVIKDDTIVEIPADEIALGHDADGLPKTISTAKEAPTERDNGAELEALRREKDEIARERDVRAAEAADRAKQLEEEKAARLAAEKHSGKSIEFGWRAHQARLKAEASQIESTLGSVSAALDTAQRELQAASEAGDHGRIAELNRQIATNAAYLTRLEEGKLNAKAEIERAEQDHAAYAEAAAQPKPEPERPTPQPRQLSPDEWIGQFPRKTANWLRDNRDYALGGAKHAELETWAKEWIADHGQSNLHSPAFIQALNEQFSPADGDDEVTEEHEPVVVESRPKPRSKAVSAAPVARTGNYFSSHNLGAQKINLDPKLKAQLTAMGLNPTSWALQAVQDIKEGKLPKEYLDPGYDRGF